MKGNEQGMRVSWDKKSVVELAELLEDISQGSIREMVRMSGYGTRTKPS